MELGADSHVPEAAARFFYALGVSGLIFYCLLVFAGATLLARPAPIAMSTAVTVTRPCAGQQNLASPACGARLRASSVDFRRSHFVGYANDGEPTPDTREKWMPLRDDLQPWIEVILYQRSDLGRLLLQSANTKEKSNLLGAKLRVLCLRDDDKTPVLEQFVRIDSARFSLPLSCLATDRLRLYFMRRVPHIYELSLFAHEKKQ